MSPVVIDVRHAQDSRDVVHRAVQALAEGKLVAFPTETVYGLAASALNEQAVARLLEVKGRREGQPLTLAIKSADEAFDYVPNLHPLCQRMARRCWPGPVTLVIKDNHPDSLLRQLPASVQRSVVPNDSIGLRVPAHRLILDVLRLLPGPLALTSANRTGQPDAISGQDVVRSLQHDVDMVLDDGRSQFGQPSSVVRVDEHGLHVLRAGVVSEDTLKRLASMLILFVCTGNTCRSPMAEGMCRKLLAEKLACRVDELEDRGVVVLSAGMSAMAGSPPAAEAVHVMADLGVELAGHVSQPLSERLVRHADVIFTMTQSHRQMLLSQWPEATSRTTLLSDNQMDIPDPIGGPREQYRRSAEQIHAALVKRIETLDLPESLP
jgi:tRNA threonylcarbamoyl adenosine modification protein (Sua5/YciO/YrdC/YwlC family)